MIHVRPPRSRACGMAAMFLLSLVWPTTSMLPTEVPVRAATPDAAGLSASSLWLAPTLDVDRPKVGHRRRRGGSWRMAKPRAPSRSSSAPRGRTSLAAMPFCIWVARNSRSTESTRRARRPRGCWPRRPPAILEKRRCGSRPTSPRRPRTGRAAVEALRALTSGKPLEPERANLRLGRAAIKAGDSTLALSALNKVFYEFPLSPEAADAATELAKLAAPVDLAFA